MFRAYYNEIDPYAAAWLRNLIAAGHIAPGEVDERSIEDVTPDDLRGFTQCHFFAGLGGWSLALRSGGWADSRKVWTGSCPCQPFSAAGKGGGFADERHLWPAFDWLIGQCRPDIVLGEQVEGPAGRAWLDLVATDVEGHGYAFGTAVFPAAGVGAPQIRHRTYWVANRDNARLEGRPGVPECSDQRASGEDGLASRLAGADASERGRMPAAARNESNRRAAERNEGNCRASGDCEAGGMAYPNNERERSAERHAARSLDAFGPSEAVNPSPVNGFWRASDWLYCRDDRWRPVESGTFPLATGASARVGRLRAYGNAICVPQAVAFVEAVTEALLSKQLVESA